MMRFRSCCATRGLKLPAADDDDIDPGPPQGPTYRYRLRLLSKSLRESTRKSVAVALFYEDLQIGTEYRSRGRTITESDIGSFAGLSGDYNSLHTDETWVRENTEFTGRIAHGLLIHAISSGIATPELDDLEVHAYLETTRRMVAPTYPGDTISVVQTVTDLRTSSSRPKSGIATMTISVVNQGGTTVQTGRDVYLVGRKSP
ncbi:MAG: hypothetical protein EOP16_01680 [Pseudonocardia sp.]|nr:MAG: hypothetical protein EOP16_01680 [Pseudonocardia sp.]